MNPLLLRTCCVLATRSFGLLCKLFEVMELLLSLLPKSLECPCSFGRHVPPVWPKTKRLMKDTGMDRVLSKETALRFLLSSFASEIKASQGALPVLSSRVMCNCFRVRWMRRVGPFYILEMHENGNTQKMMHFKKLQKDHPRNWKAWLKIATPRKGKTQTRTAAMFTNTRNCASAFS